MMRFVGQHPRRGATGALAFLAANLFDLGALRRHKAFLLLLNLVEQQAARDEAVESLLPCLLTFDLQTGRAMPQHHAGGGLVDVLPAVSAAADETFLDV